MRICWLADAQSPHTTRWSAFLTEQGHTLDIISFRPGELPGAHIHSFSWASCLGKARYLLYLPAIRKLIHRLQPDILHAHHATSYGLAGALAGWHPFLIHTWGRDVLDFPQNPAYRLMVRFNLGRADIVTSTSHAMADAICELGPETTPVRVIPFGVDLSHFQPGPAPKPSTTSLAVGVVKSLEPIYGIEYLLRAFSTLCSQNPDLKLLIVGDGSQRHALESLAQELGIGDNTHFVGYVSHEQVAGYLREMDIFVVPSLQESFGVAAVEASATGLPVIASNVGGLPEVIVEGKTGFLVPPADADALSQRLFQLIADPALRHRMGEAGRAFVSEHYDWQSNAAEMEQLYNAILEGKLQFTS